MNSSTLRRRAQTLPPMSPSIPSSWHFRTVARTLGKSREYPNPQSLACGSPASPVSTADTAEPLGPCDSDAAVPGTSNDD